MGPLTRLRNKPEAARRRILYMSTVVIFAVIFLLWVASLPYRLESIAGPDSANPQKDYSPFTVVAGEVKGVWGDFTRGIEVIGASIFGE